MVWNIDGAGKNQRLRLFARLSESARHEKQIEAGLACAHERL